MGCDLPKRPGIRVGDVIDTQLRDRLPTRCPDDQILDLTTGHSLECPFHRAQVRRAAGPSEGVEIFTPELVEHEFVALPSPDQFQRSADDGVV
jgi:hypothetical protein